MVPMSVACFETSVVFAVYCYSTIISIAVRKKQQTSGIVQRKERPAISCLTRPIYIIYRRVPKLLRSSLVVRNTLREKDPSPVSRGSVTIFFYFVLQRRKKKWHTTNFHRRYILGRARPRLLLNTPSPTLSSHQLNCLYTPNDMPVVTDISL